MYVEYRPTDQFKLKKTQVNILCFWQVFLQVCGKNHQNDGAKTAINCAVYKIYNTKITTVSITFVKTC